jgi:hypothetical protein
VFVERTTIEQLAEGRGTNPAWVARLDAMARFARARRWADGAGAIRAHVELADALR